jgi:hypothetical protein
MGSLLVTYDLVGTDDSSDNYEKLIAQIKRYPKWARVELSTWIVKTEDQSKDVRDKLWTHMHPKDRLFVAKLTGQAAWHNAKCKDQWLKDNL